MNAINKSKENWLDTLASPQKLKCDEGAHQMLKRELQAGLR